jgi:transposase
MSAADLPPETNAAAIGKKKQGPRAARPTRRNFTADYKAAILAEYEALTEPGSRGALLRREGLYSSHIVAWTRAREAGARGGLAPKPTGPKPGNSDAERRAEKLEAENKRLADELAKAKQANEILGKLSEVLSLLAETSDGKTRQNP